MEYIKPHHQILMTQLLEYMKGDTDILGVVLYGSAVRQSIYRDIDICIIPESNVDTTELFHKYLRLTENPIEIRMFRDLPLYIQVQVMKTGKILVQKDYDRLFEVYMNAIRRWRDFEPHFQTYLEAVKHG
jgi:predicted nucleotidyltransferase